MKRILLFLFLAVAGITQAQIVNIPDPVFKAKLVNASPSSSIATDFAGNYMTIDVNNDNEIQVSEAQAVRRLEVLSSEPVGMHPQIETLEGINSFYNLEILVCFNNLLTELDVSSLSNLKYLDARSNQLTSININGLINIETLFLFENNLSNLNISGLLHLKILNCSDNPISSINLLPFELLEVFACKSCQLSEIDLSNSSNLRRVQVSNCQLLNSINLKNNGITGEPQYSDFSECPNLAYICVDEGEASVLNTYVPDSIQMNSYCSDNPAGNYNTIEGIVLFDYDNNGCSDDQAIATFLRVNITEGNETNNFFTNDGSYAFYVEEGAFTITPDFDNDLFTITPSFSEINFNAVDNSVSTQNFCISPNGNHPDLDIVIVPFDAQPGFNTNYKIIYKNKGNQILSGTIIFNYQEDVLDYISSYPVESSAAPGTLTWNFTDLLPFQQKILFVRLNVNGPMETPPVNIDDQLSFIASINPATGDETPDDNTFELNQIVVGSYDPNDITCLEGKSVNPDKIGEYLHYNINFENTGTAPATFIVVKDVIDTTQFDMATLQMINASHQVQAKIADNKVEFRFDDIDLGPEEKGNVVFKIKTLNTLQANDDVTQQADIFFDYNWPIQTNEATTVFEVLSISDFEKDNSVKIYPNPSNGIVSITAASEIKSFELYDVQGRLLQAGSSNSLDISARTAGMYFVKVLTENGMKVEKVVKK